MVKWWDKYNFTKVQERLHTEFSGQASQVTQPAPKAPKKSSPSTSSKDQQSSSSKSKTKSSSEKTSKKDILAIAQALLSQISDGEDETNSSDSSVHLDNIKDSFQDPLGAQDPYASDSN
ncbi:hypothetical protein SLA2020_493350 [Shorea laevis]